MTFIELIALTFFNPFEYLFDELGLLMSTVTLGAGVYRDYQKEYPKHKKREENMTGKEKIKEGIEDFEHHKDVEKKKEEQNNDEG